MVTGNIIQHLKAIRKRHKFNLHFAESISQHDLVQNTKWAQRNTCQNTLSTDFGPKFGTYRYMAGCFKSTGCQQHVYRFDISVQVNAVHVKAFTSILHQVINAVLLIFFSTALVLFGCESGVCIRAVCARSNK